VREGVHMGIIFSAREELLIELVKHAEADMRMLGRMGQNICPVCAHYNHGAGDPKHCPKALKEDCFEWRGMKEG
jgi:hypothetical protein